MPSIQSFDSISIVQNHHYASTLLSLSSTGHRFQLLTLWWSPTGYRGSIEMKWSACEWRVEVNKLLRIAEKSHHAFFDRFSASTACINLVIVWFINIAEHRKSSSKSKARWMVCVWCGAHHMRRVNSFSCHSISRILISHALRTCDFVAAAMILIGMEFTKPSI